MRENLVDPPWLGNRLIEGSIFIVLMVCLDQFDILSYCNWVLTDIMMCLFWINYIMLSNPIVNDGGETSGQF